MNPRHRRTLAAIYAQPTPATLLWREIEALFVALGAKIAEREGSRVNVSLGGARATFHRPHPGREVGRLTIRDVRDFLSNAGVAP